MRDIVISNCRLLRKSKLVYVGFFLVLITSIGLILYVNASNNRLIDKIANQELNMKTDTIRSLGNVFYRFPIVIVPTLMVICPIVIGINNSHGIVRNMLVIGKKRRVIFVANMITAIILVMVYMVAWTIPMITIGIRKLKMANIWSDVFKKTLLGVLIVMLFAILYTSITILFRSSRNSLATCVIVVIILAIFTVVIKSRSLEIKKTEMIEEINEAEKYNEIEKLKVDIKIEEKIKKLDYFNTLFHKEEIETQDKILKKKYDQLYELNDTPQDKYIEPMSDIENRKKWLKIKYVNPIDQALYFSEWKEDRYKYTVNRKRQENSSLDEKKEIENIISEYEVYSKLEGIFDNPQNFQRAFGTPNSDEKYLAQYRARYEEYTAKDDEIKAVGEDNDIDKKRYMIVERKLRKDPEFKKLREQQRELKKSNNRLGDINYKKFDIKKAFLADVIYCVILLGVSYNIFMKKNIK